MVSLREMRRDGASLRKTDPGERCIKFIEKLTVEDDFRVRPFKLADFQKDIIRKLFGTIRPDGKRQYKELFAGLPRGSGKALDLDTPIPTPDGWTTMGAIEVGDMVYDENGNPTRVDFVSEVMYDRPCYRVEFSDRTSIVADAEHLWVTSNPDRKPKTYTTEEIAGSLYRGKPGRVSFGPKGISTNTEYAHRLPRVKSLECPDAELPIEPYTLGAWLGDGHNAGSRITGHVDDVVIPAEIAREGYAIGSVRVDGRSGSTHTYGVGGKQGCAPLQTSLRVLGLLGNKHIPSVYLRSSKRQRISLLQGLMDTDGTCGKSGNCEFNNKNETLARGVLELVRSLGLKAILRTKIARCNGKDCGICYRVCFTAAITTIGPVFRLPRKFERQSIVEGLGQARKITAVVPVESVPVKCIQVDSPSRLYLAGEGMVPTHNTTLIAAIALYCLIACGKFQHIYSASGDREQAALIFEAARGMIQRDPYLSTQVEVYSGKKRLVYPRGNSHYQALSSDSNHPLGLKPSVCIFDEVLVFPNRNLHDALITGMGKRSERLCIYITTAGSNKNTFCYQLWQHAAQVQAGKKEDPTLLPVIYAADPEKDDWRKEETWFKASPALGKFLSLEHMREKLAKAIESPAEERIFKQFYLNIWVEGATRWLNVDLWDQLAASIELEDYKGRDCYLGFDLSSNTDLTCCSAIFPEDDGTLTIIPFFFVPRNQAEERERRDKVSYCQWGSEGHLILTDGYDGLGRDDPAIRRWVNEFGEKYNILKIGFDPWNAGQLMNDLLDDGHPVHEMRQVMANLAAPTKEFERLILTKQLRHDGNPCMRWNVGNVSVQPDTQGNIMPSKSKSVERMDGVQATVVALAMVMADRGTVKPDLFF